MSAHRYCSFCGKRHDEVRHLIAGPGGTGICNECVDLMGGMIAEADAEGRTLGVRPPRPVKEFREEAKQRLTNIVKLK